MHTHTQYTTLIKPNRLFKNKKGAPIGRKEMYMKKICVCEKDIYEIITE